MAVLEWIGQHPFLTFVILCFMCGTLVEIVRAITGKYPPPDSDDE